MNIVQRIRRHIRIANKVYQDAPDPPFLVLFINSICNMQCEHCFYWTSLNKKDDLTFDELVLLSESLGKIENLNLSGGEPFLRKDLGEVCSQFIRHNGVRQIYVPSNGYFTKRTITQITRVLKNPELELFVVELSLDGMPDFHDTFRVTKNSFRKAMETYDALVELQKQDSRLRIHCISTATDKNMEQIRKLTTYLYERCPSMDHHNLAIIRGDRKNPTLHGPVLKQYEELYDYVQKLWSPREEGRYGSIVEPMLQWAKVETVRQQRQVVPCRAGRLSAVVYANGDVSMCEIHEPLGNLRNQSFNEIWNSEKASKLRTSIKAGECYCTTEVFLWPSFTYPPLQLGKALLASKAWRKPGTLAADEQQVIKINPETRLPVEDKPDNQSGLEVSLSSLIDNAVER